MRDTGIKSKSVTGSKKYKLRFRAVNRDIFEAIKNGSKKVETRAATEKYRDIKAGDELILICGRRKFKKTVKKTQIFKSIRAMLDKYKVNQIHPGFKNFEELAALHYSFPNYRQKLKMFGIIAMELK